MKLTVDISAHLYHEAKALARTEKTTMRELVERGLRLALAEHQAKPPFRLRDSSFGGEGLHPDAAKLTWSEILARSYGTCDQEP